mmetsp:Transcript_19178/g.44671  ORF Transcript_19178/g.44671 Transcript_19178/m.44671 type:complete len:347 (-) Transcript_19178:50-1090(-)
MLGPPRLRVRLRLGRISGAVGLLRTAGKRVLRAFWLGAVAAELAAAEHAQRVWQRQVEGRRDRDERRRLVAVLPESLRAVALAVALDGLVLGHRHAGAAQQNEHREARRHEPEPRVAAHARRQRAHEHAPPHQDLAPVVRVAAPLPDADVADAAAVGRVGAELALLVVSNELHQQAVHEQRQPHVIGGLEVRVGVGRAREHHGRRDRPRPQRLEDPEGEEAAEVLAHLVEAVVFAALEHAHQQEQRQLETADAHVRDQQEVPSAVVPADEQAHERDRDEVHGPGEVGDLVELAAGGHQEAGALDADGDHARPQKRRLRRPPITVPRVVAQGGRATVHGAGGCEDLV